MDGVQILLDLIAFAQNEPETATIITLVGVIVIFFFINMIGGNEKGGE